MKISVYNTSGKETTTRELPAKLFEVALNPVVVKQVIVAQQANKRQTLAHTKGRSDVRGGGKKPWRQKGTGRARHGSIRSPLWVGGGVTFGPTKERNFKKKINKKVRQAALRMLLSDKAAHNNFIIVDDLGEITKTKQAASLVSALPVTGRPALVLTETADTQLKAATANLPKVGVCVATDVNPVLLAQYEKVIISESALENLIKHFDK